MSPVVVKMALHAVKYFHSYARLWGRTLYKVFGRDLNEVELSSKQVAVAM
jgi:hypothetical protein